VRWRGSGPESVNDALQKWQAGFSKPKDFDEVPVAQKFAPFERRKGHGGRTPKTRDAVPRGFHTATLCE